MSAADPPPAIRTLQAMDPKDVSEEILNAFKTAGYAAMMTPGAAGDLSDRYLAGGLAAVIPAIRAQVADEIEAARLRLDPHDSRHDGMEHAEHIARGDQ